MTDCPGNIAGPHIWHLFPGGQGCWLCPAWVSIEPRCDDGGSESPLTHVDAPLYLRDAG